MSDEKDVNSEQKDIVDERPIHSTDAVAHEGERHGVHHDIPDHGHNPSLQKDVIENPDITLHYSHEHQHNHMHHGRSSLVARHDELLYAKGSELDNRHDLIVNQDHSHHQHSLKPGMETIETKDHIYSESGTSDPEKSGFEATRIDTNETDDGQKHRFSRFYRKYKIFFHLFIWLVFTA